MATPETDIEKLQLSLAGAALSLISVEKQLGKDSLQAFQIAQLLGYEGLEHVEAVSPWLTAFFNGPTARRVAERMQRRSNNEL